MESPYQVRRNYEMTWVLINLSLLHLNNFVGDLDNKVNVKLLLERSGYMGYVYACQTEKGNMKITFAFFRPRHYVPIKQCY